MAIRKVIKAKISPNGEQLSIETIEGFEGTHCAETLNEIEVGIGLVNGDETKKEEYFKTPDDVFININ